MMYLILQSRDQLKKRLPWLDVYDLFGEIKLENVKRASLVTQSKLKSILSCFPPVGSRNLFLELCG